MKKTVAKETWKIKEEKKRDKGTDKEKKDIIDVP